MKFSQPMTSVSASDCTRREFLQRCVSLALPPLLLGSVAGSSARAATLIAPARARGPTTINVRDEGAHGDGRNDETRAFQSAIDALPSEGGTVLVPAGTYLIDAVVSVNLRSRMHLQLAPGAKLVAIPNAEKKSYVLYAYKVSDVEISGGQITGERAGHLGTAGEWGHGIQIRGASRVTVRDIRIADCWGDGVCIGGAEKQQATPSDDIVIANIVSTGNRRQGLSIGRSRNVRVYGSEFSNTSGTNPQYGIDIEPDRPGGATDIHIESCVIRNNRGGGIQIFRRVTDVTIKDCTIEGNGGRGILAITAARGVVTGNRIQGNGLVGVVLQHQTADFEIRDNHFSNNDTKRRVGAKLRANAGDVPATAVRIGEDTTGISVTSNQYDNR